MRKFYKIQPFSVGQKVTLIGMNFMAMTFRRHLIVKTVLPEPKQLDDGRVRYGTYSEPRKRKEFYLDVDKNTLVFEGHEKPFQLDSEAFNVFSGNACLNLVGDANVIAKLVENDTLLAVDDDTKARILVSDPAEDRSNGYDFDATVKVLYPGHALKAGHAVVSRILEKQGITRETWAELDAAAAS